MALLCQPCGLSMALGRALPAPCLLTRSMRVSDPRIRQSIRAGKSRSAKWDAEHGSTKPPALLIAMKAMFARGPVRVFLDVLG
jgi:hypothetical protein